MEARNYMLAVDLDGTLLRSDLTVSARNRAAIANLLAMGVQVVFATGRTYSSAAWYAALWPDYTLWIAACNGAIIRPADGGSPVQERIIPLPVARQFADWAQQEGFYLKTYVDDLLLVPKAVEETWSFSESRRMSFQEVGDVAKALKKGPAKMVIIDTPDRIAAREAGIVRLWGGVLEITSSTPDCLEFTAAGVSKGSALKFLTQRLNIEPNRVAAIGNERNDLSMIDWAGYGGAVANAPSSVRKTARVVVGDHDDDGVAEFIDAWLAREQMKP